MSYGSHPNDFLLAECESYSISHAMDQANLAIDGFFLEKNESDCIYLDDIIFRDITSPDKREELSLNQYYGYMLIKIAGIFNANYFTRNYQVTSQGVCYRTEVAACLKYMKEENWRNHVLEGSTEGVDEKLSGDIIKGWLQTYCMEAEAAVDALRAAMESDAVVQAHRQKGETLLRRWAQIKEVCESASRAIDL